jgi:cephalosporin-C deacetylase-like acetyl esterase
MFSGRMKALFAAAACFLILPQMHAAQETPTSGSRSELIQYLNSQAHQQLEQRSQTVAKISSRTAAEQRAAWARRQVLKLIGGLPGERGPLNVRNYGSLNGEGFRVEKIVYDSLPGFHVTANLYLPAGQHGPYPAIIFTPGHGPDGKTEAYTLGGNFARNGIALLAWDPIGQGERLQYFDPATGKSKVGHPTGEHSEASLQTMLLGDQISRYFVWDAMRGIDYLISRHDIDAGRIGALGCSGGGTDTAYLAALDSRIKVAGVACYITSFDALLSSIGPQDAEQSIPNFISSGLDFPDWIEMFAPRPYAVISTTEDMFPFAGARQSYEEAKRIYSLYGAGDRLQWITGPGKHGHLAPIYPQILGFFTHWLEGSNAPPTLTALTVPPMKDLLCTPTGQIATSLGGETIWSLNKKRAAQIIPRKAPVTATAALSSLHTDIQRDIRNLAHVTAIPGTAAPDLKVTGTEQRANYRLESVIVSSVTGSPLPGYVAIPNKEPSPFRLPAVLLLSSQPWADITAAGGTLDRLAASGKIVFAPAPLPTPAGSEELKAEVVGSYYLLSLRAMLAGKTLVGLRVDDAIRAVDWLRSQPDVDPKQIEGYGIGSMGVVLLHAAALDAEIAGVTVVKTLVNYRSIVDEQIPQDISESEIPGALLHYDLDDLLLAIGPRPVRVIDPIDAEKNPLSEEQFHQAMARVFEVNERLHRSDSVKVLAGAP